MKKNNMSFSCDFETSTWDDKKTYVWAWASCELESLYTVYGNNIESFMNYIFSIPCNPKLFFHNLKFDGSFILNWLFKNGFEWVADKKERKENCFLTLITDKGQWYKITIYLKVGKNPHYIEIFDSLKKLPFSVKNIAESFNLPILKGELDYYSYRSESHLMTEEEKKYIKNDVEIVARALNILESQGMSKMTTSANALNFYKDLVGKNFDRMFPKLTPPVDNYIRKSYKGGFTYVNEKYKNKNIGEGIVLDVNSLYPSRMKFENLPIGKPIYYKGKYVNNENYPLFVQQLSCIFELKDGYIPTIQVKNNRWRFAENEYLKSSNGERVTLTLTSVDLQLFMEHYEVYEIRYLEGFMFRSCKGMFDKYIDYWTEQKIKAKKEGNGGIYTLSKLMLNSLYGKFGTNPKSALKIPYLEDGILKFKISEITERDSIYIPIATFITAYARNYTIRSAQKVYERFLYADTDSLHLTEKEIPKGLKVDDYELGAWKHESTFDRAFYIRQKCYIENECKTTKDLKQYKEKFENLRKLKLFHVKQFDKDYKIKGIRKIKVTVAGLPENLRKFVNFDNFKEGLILEGKLSQRQIKGGAFLANTTFEIKKV